MLQGARCLHGLVTSSHVILITLKSFKAITNSQQSKESWVKPVLETGDVRLQPELHAGPEEVQQSALTCNPPLPVPCRRNALGASNLKEECGEPSSARPGDVLPLRVRLCHDSAT